MGGRRGAIAQQLREAEAPRRSGRARHLRPAGSAGVALLHRLGATANAARGAATAGISTGRLHGLGASAAASAGRLPRGAPLGLGLHCNAAGVKVDPLVIHSAEVAWMWALTVWEGQVKPRVLEVLMQTAERKAAQASAPWRTASTPADAALLTMRRLGWRFEGPFVLLSDEMVRFDLKRVGPRQVQEAVRRGAVRASDRLALQSTGKALPRGAGAAAPCLPVFWSPLRRLLWRNADVWRPRH